jgi:thiol-disulfide isomerase/thioredoxin
MFRFAAKFEEGLAYHAFLDRYASPEHRSRWDATYNAIALKPAQKELLQSFVREMKVLVMCGAWCGDCIKQCPSFEHFAAVAPKIQVRYCDRDDHPDLAAELQTCGAARVPCVVFLAEDGAFCGRYGDRTLSKYRRMMSKLTGASCPTGLFTDADELAEVTQDWLDEFERIHAMLRTSSRLRQLHGD